MKNMAIFLALIVFASSQAAAETYQIDFREYAKLMNATGAGLDDATISRSVTPCQYSSLSECQNALREFAQQEGNTKFIELARCVECGGSSGNSGGDPEQQPENGYQGGRRGEPVAEAGPKPRTGGQEAFNQNKKGLMRTLKQRSLQPHDPSAKDEIAELRAELERKDSVTMMSMKRLVVQRQAEPNPWCQSIARSLKIKAPPNPYKTVSQLQPGDVLLVEPDTAKTHGIMLLDRLATWDHRSPLNHTLTYLREIGGKKFFLDNESGLGMRIISEDKFREIYGKRSVWVAQPVGKIDSGKLWEAARELILTQSNKSHGMIDESNYGLWGNKDMVCSETSRWLLIRAGLDIKRTGSLVKIALGLNYSPANFWLDDQDFLITPLSFSR